MAELTYHKNGLDIKTSLFLKNRGSCCKTACLHCPYGFTLKKLGLQFEDISDTNFSEAKNIEKLHTPEQIDIAASLFASAFGKPKTKEILSTSNMKSFMLVKLKNESCALIKKNQIQATEIYLNKYFEDQGLTLDLVNSCL